MWDFIKREVVFVIALTAAVVSAFFNPPRSLDFSIPEK